MSKTKGMMSINDIRRVRKTSSEENNSTKEPSEVTEGSLAGDVEPVRNSYAWQFLLSLHNGDGELTDKLLTNTSLSKTDTILLHGIKAAWLEESTAAQELMQKVLALSKISDEHALWSNIILANMYIDIGNGQAVDRYISRGRLSIVKKAEANYLTTLLELVDLRGDIERGNYRNPELRLTSIIEKCLDRWLVGFAKYLFGCLGRYKRLIKNNERISYLREAISIFDSKVYRDRYMLALCNLELSACDIDVAEGIRLASGAIEEFKLLGRTRDAHIAEVRANELYKGSKTNFEFTNVLGTLFYGERMQAIRLDVDLIAADDATVLIVGDRGTGKDLIARVIHHLSNRRDQPFMAINCATLPAHLFESELFGYLSGAFTDAKKDKPGIFAAAKQGSIFLDEIGELPLEMQSKLLRVLQNRMFRPVGSNEEIPINARIIAATNRSLRRMVGSGKFRADLLDRLTSWVINLPRLNERREEILPLAELFVRRKSGSDEFIIDHSAKEYLLSIDYEGNIRTLEHLINRAVVIARSRGSKTITASMFGNSGLVDIEELVQSAADQANQNCQISTEVEVIPIDLEYQSDPLSSRESFLSELLPQKLSTLETSLSEVPTFEEALFYAEKRYFELVLQVSGNNKKLAQGISAIPTSTFYRRLRALGIEVKDDQ